MDKIRCRIGFRGFELDGGADRMLTGNLEIVVTGEYFQTPEQLRVLSRLFEGVIAVEMDYFGNLEIHLEEHKSANERSNS